MALTSGLGELGGNGGSEAVETGAVAALVFALGDDVSLSANELAAFGYAACGALAKLPDDVTGIDMLGGSAGVLIPATGVAGEPAAARFADDGGAAGVSPATATGWGVD